MMPKATPGGMTLTLCTAQGPVSYKLDIHGGQPADEAHDPCPYGALGFVPLLPLPMAAAAPVLVSVAAAQTFAPRVLRPHVAAPAPPPPATGPPAAV